MVLGSLQCLLTIRPSSIDCFGFAWTTVVAAELNNGIPGIGGLAYVSGTQLQTPLTIACIIVIGLAAVGLDALIAAVGRVATPWQGRA